MTAFFAKIYLNPPLSPFFKGGGEFWWVILHNQKKAKFEKICFHGLANDDLT
jgi:hypothetical protein